MILPGVRATSTLPFCLYSTPGSNSPNPCVPVPAPQTLSRIPKQDAQVVDSKPCGRLHRVAPALLSVLPQTLNPLLPLSLSPVPKTEAQVFERQASCCLRRVAPALLHFPVPTLNPLLLQTLSPLLFQTLGLASSSKP